MIIDIQEIKQFILNFVKTQSFLARSSLIQNTLSNLSQFSQKQIEQAIQELCQQKQIKILNDKVKPEEQLICFIPSKESILKVVLRYFLITNKDRYRR